MGCRFTRGSVQLVAVLRPGLARSVGSVFAVAISAVVACGLVAWDQFWLWPMVVDPDPGSVYSRLPEENLAGVQRLVLVWVALVLAATAYEMLRLRARPRWKWDYGYSPWRTTKSALLVYGWAVVSSILPNTAMGMALFKLVDLSGVERNTSLLLFNVVSALLALLLAWGMVIVDVVAGARTPRIRTSS